MKKLLGLSFIVLISMNCQSRAPYSPKEAVGEEPSKAQEWSTEYEETVSLHLVEASRELLATGACRKTQAEGSVEALSCESAKNYSESTPSEISTVLKDKEGLKEVKAEVEASGGTQLTFSQIAGITMICAGAVALGGGAIGLHQFSKAHKEWPLSKYITKPVVMTNMHKLAELEQEILKNPKNKQILQNQKDAIMNKNKTLYSQDNIDSFQKAKIKRGVISAFFVMGGLSAMSSGVSTALGLTGESRTPFTEYINKLGEIYQELNVN